MESNLADFARKPFCYVVVVVCFCLMGVYVAVLVSLGPLLFWYAAYYLHSLWQNVLLNKMCKSWMVVIRAEVSDRGWACWKRHPSFSLLFSYSGWSTIHVQIYILFLKMAQRLGFPTEFYIWPWVIVIVVACELYTRLKQFQPTQKASAQIHILFSNSQQFL